MLVLKTTKQTVTRFAFSADGGRLAVAGTGKKVHVWDLTAARLKPTVSAALPDPIRFLGFRPDGRVLALARLERSLLFDPVAGRATSATRAPTGPASGR